MKKFTILCMIISLFSMRHHQAMDPEAITLALVLKNRQNAADQELADKLDYVKNFEVQKKEEEKKHNHFLRRLRHEHKNN